MDIRKVTLDEVTEVLALIDGYERPKSSWPNKEEIESIYLSLTANGGCVVGAFENGKLVGTSTLNVCPNFSWSGRPYAMIENVIVSKQCRNRGVGKAILAYCRDVAEQLGCYKVALMTGSKKEATLKFYESAGFVGNKTGYQARFNAK